MIEEHRSDADDRNKNGPAEFGQSPARPDREIMTYDVAVVGAGPAGLSCALRMKQKAASEDRQISVCVLEKGAQVGAHLLSGAVLDPCALNKLVPDWRERQAPLDTETERDEFYYLTARRAWRLPVPPQMRNKGNYIISLSRLAGWLAGQAEEAGAEIYPGFAAAEILYDTQGAVIGIATGDRGLDKNGEKTQGFEPGIEIHARQTVFAEGCHGSLSKQLISRFNLRDPGAHQTYALGVKEVWEVPLEKHCPGLVVHTVGWPLDGATYGGSWIYHYGAGLVSIGLVVGLDYRNPYLSPFEEMQRLKTHPYVRKMLEGGRRIGYGARALVEGGLQSVPQLCFPGGVLVGDAAGFLDVPKIKGNHNAMYSGMIAANSLYELYIGSGGDADPGTARAPASASSPASSPTVSFSPSSSLDNNGLCGNKHHDDAPTYSEGSLCSSYPKRLKESRIWKDLYKSRNIRPGFRWGLWGGMVHAAFQTLGGWRIPYTLRHHRPDHATLKPAAKCAAPDYPAADGILTFDRLSSVHLTNTYHDEMQPAHLRLKDYELPVKHHLPLYAGPSRFYCPAGVYEILDAEGENPQFVINAQNCIHCKSCDIKDPAQNILWTVPYGGGGPNYSDM